GLQPCPDGCTFGGRIADLLNCQTREDRLRVTLDEFRTGSRGIRLLEQEPLLVLLGHPGERPPATKLEAEQLDLHLPLGKVLEWIAFLDRSVPSAIPDDDASGAVVASRNDPFKIGVLDRVVFHMNRETLLLRPHGRALGNGPALEDSVHLKAQVVVEI